MNNMISIIIPARDEEENIEGTVSGIREVFDKAKISFEILIVNDGSTDATVKVVGEIQDKDSRIRLINNDPPYGIGNAIKKGLDEFKGDYVIVAMADASDDPEDMVAYVREIEKGADCCFGNRWAGKNLVEGYPKHKLILNRMANWIISFMFRFPYKDVTNAFKCYSKETIEGIRPILSHHFNITVELPLKAICRGYSYTVVPTRWSKRKKGKTNLKIEEMGSRYLFILLYVFLEKVLCRKDYFRKK